MEYSKKVMDERLTKALRGQILHIGLSSETLPYEVEDACFSDKYDLVYINCWRFYANGKVNKTRKVPMYVGIEKDTVQAISLNYIPLYFQVNQIPNSVCIEVKERNLGEEILERI